MEKSRMRFFKPELYQVFNSHLNPGDESGYKELNDAENKWDNGMVAYWDDWVSKPLFDPNAEGAPQIVRDFYHTQDGIGSLHDALVQKWDVKDKHATLELFRQYGTTPKVRIELDFDEAISQTVFPEWLVKDRDPPQFLYDEFSDDQGQLHYTCFFDNGCEWHFRNVRNLKWNECPRSSED